MERNSRWCTQSRPKSRQIGAWPWWLVHQNSNMFPEHTVRVIELCKGTDRYRKPPIRLMPKEAPWRYSLGIHRHSLEPMKPDEWTKWESLSNRQICRKSDPARLMISIFARLNTVNPEDGSMVPKLNKRSSELHGILEPERVKKPKQGNLEDLSSSSDRDEIEPALMYPLPEANEPKAEHVPPESSKAIRESFQKHGPKFLALPAATRSWIVKLHHNLGHPSPAKLMMVLKQQNYEDSIVQGVEDLKCSTCHELQEPKIARPAALSDPREFNDCVGCDLLTWTSKNGKTFQRIHVVDSATSFQIAVPVYQTDADALFEAFQDGWLWSARPCKQLIIDNESALCSDQFALLSQQNNIHLRVVAAYAHWQMGKTERHGDILQHILKKIWSWTCHWPWWTISHCIDVSLQCQERTSPNKGLYPRNLGLGKRTVVTRKSQWQSMATSQLSCRSRQPWRNCPSSTAHAKRMC